MSELDIESIKRYGAIKELKAAIRAHQHTISTKLWGGTAEGHTFSGLGMAIRKGEAELYKIKALLEALQKLEPENK